MIESGSTGLAVFHAELFLPTHPVTLVLSAQRSAYHSHMLLKKQGKYRFTDFELNLARRTLERRGHPIALSSRTFDLLAVLVVSAPRVVAKQELMRVLGEDPSNEESNLGQHVFLLQKALSGIDPGEKLILRVPGQGYKFTATVTPVPVEEPEPEPEAETEPGVELESEPIPTFIPRFTAFGVDASSKSGHARGETDKGAESEAGEASDSPTKKSLLEVLRHPGTLLIAAFLGLVLALAFGAWFAWGRFHWPGATAEPASLRLILASFRNSTGDRDFEQSLKTALTLDLQQSPYLSVAPESRVAEALAALRIPVDQELPRPAASQLCQRLNGELYLTAEIRRLAHNYLVSVAAFACSTGKDLGESRGIADSPDAVVAVLDKVAGDLRRQMGEPRRSVAEFSRPLFAQRAASLTALKAYADASEFQREGKFDDAIQLFHRATFLDPKFALAYADLSAVHQRLGQAEAANAMLSKAYELRETVDQQQGFILTSAFHDRVTGDLLAALRNDKQWANLYPRNPVPLTHLANLEIQLGEPALALEPARKALALNPDNPAAYVILARAQMYLGQFEEAAGTCQQAIERQVDGAEVHQFLLQIGFLRLDQPAIDEQMAWAQGKPEEPEMLLERGLINFAEGHPKAAVTAFQAAAEGFRKQNQLTRATEILAMLPRIQAELGLVDGADAQLRRLPEGANSMEIPVAWAHVGETSRAAAILKHELEAHPGATMLRQAWAPQVRAAIAMNQHQPQAAIDALAPTGPPEQANFDLSGFAIPALRGRAYLAASQPVAAEAEFHKILDHPGIEPLSHNYPLAQLGLARSLAAQGKTTEAGFAYKIVLQIWKEADPELPRVREARAEYARLGSLTAKSALAGAGGARSNAAKPGAGKAKQAAARPRS